LACGWHRVGRRRAFESRRVAVLVPASRPDSGNNAAQGDDPSDGRNQIHPSAPNPVDEWVEPSALLRRGRGFTPQESDESARHERVLLLAQPSLVRARGVAQPASTTHVGLNDSGQRRSRAPAKAQRASHPRRIGEQLALR
jgi:hypothetical protein